MAIQNVNWLGSNIAEDSTHRLVTDEQIEKWNRGGGYKLLDVDVLDFDALEDGKYIYYIKFNEDNSIKEDQWTAIKEGDLATQYGMHLIDVLNEYCTKYRFTNGSFIVFTLIDQELSLCMYNGISRYFLSYSKPITNTIRLPESSVVCTGTFRVSSDNYFNDLHVQNLDVNANNVTINTYDDTFSVLHGEQKFWPCIGGMEIDFGDNTIFNILVDKIYISNPSSTIDSGILLVADNIGTNNQYIECFANIISHGTIISCGLDVVPFTVNTYNGDGKYRFSWPSNIEESDIDVPLKIEGVYKWDGILDVSSSSHTIIQEITVTEMKDSDGNNIESQQIIKFIRFGKSNNDNPIYTILASRIQGDYGDFDITWGDWKKITYTF